MRGGSVIGVAALVVGCQVSPPELPGAPPPVSASVLARFALEDAEGPSLLDPVHVLGQSSEADEEGQDAPSAAIELEDVLASVETHFPLILAALEEIDIAEGRVLQAKGGFDTQLGAKGKFDVEGFYQTDNVDISLEQPTALWGMTFSGGYRYGAGNFAIWDGDQKTNDSGEFRFGVNVPLLQDRAIDPRRVRLWRSRIEREKAEPVVLQKRLETTLKAADVYWKWVSAGRLREISRRLLALAEDRMDQVERAVEEGELARINLTENQRLIVDRQAKLARAERFLQESALLLSLYWRNELGQPVVPPDSALPYEFPSPRELQDVIFPGDVELGLQQRPEIRALELALADLGIRQDLAQNRLLPNLDFGMFASQDVGNPVNDPDDKSPFELEALVNFNVPIQRRQPKGKQIELEARVAKLERERQFLKEVVTTEIRDAASALTQSWVRIEQNRENVRLAGELAEAERLQVRAGESDLLRVNIRERQAALAAAELVEVLEEYFRALARYRAVMGIPYDEVLEP